MATRNTATKIDRDNAGKRKRAAPPRASKAHVPAKRPRRASERGPTGIVIDLANRALREFMTEQCRSDEGRYLTIYRAPHALLLASGVPANAFPAIGATESTFDLVTAGACSTGSCEQLRGSLRAIDDGFELEIDWGSVMPYVQHAHPAICELARMLWIRGSDWVWGEGEPGKPDPRTPIDRLIEDERAEGYKPKPSKPRPQLSPKSVKALDERLHEIYYWVHANCEVMPRPATARCEQPVQPRGLRLAVDNTRTQP
jgi:hypothetical protein